MNGQEFWALIASTAAIQVLATVLSTRLMLAKLEIHVAWIKEQLTAQDKRLTYLEHQGGKKR